MTKESPNCSDKSQEIDEYLSNRETYFWSLKAMLGILLGLVFLILLGEYFSPNTTSGMLILSVFLLESGLVVLSFNALSALAKFTCPRCEQTFWNKRRMPSLTCSRCKYSLQN